MSTAGYFGPLVLWEGEEPVSADIIFVHGLNGNREQTWSAASTLWPRDLLPDDLPHARVITWGYNANVLRLSAPSSQNSIFGHVNSLLLDVERLRQTQEKQNRRIILVGHSLGGLVIKGAIIRSYELLSTGQDPEQGAIYAQIAGVIFLGTPHRGSGKTQYAHIIGNIFSTVKKVSQKIINVLEQDSDVLDVKWQYSLNDQGFHSTLENQRQSFTSVSKDIRLVCLYEELSTPPIGLVVPQHSAVIDGYNVRSASISGDHSSMCKFVNHDDNNYQRVLQ
ncbi:MAG: hypothetical protein LQ346_007042 [Caloplaca aetnensis]|nr:MAG: hypothetical protein LQ346_007042 [Caloplaca aetnensis]